MKVKIGDKIYDSSKEPIMIIMDEQDKKNINNMVPEATKYCSFPDNWNLDTIKYFMKIKEEYEQI